MPLPNRRSTARRCCSARSPRTPSTRRCSRRCRTTQRDFAPVFFIGNIANVRLVDAKQPMKSVKDLIAAAKAKPGTLAFGTPGAGSSQHLSGERFGLDAGVDLIHVPYKGSGSSDKT